jgi:glycosyltransferase involved in cell wall biosynthesis
MSADKRSPAFRVLHVIGGSQYGGVVPCVSSLVTMAREHGGDAVVLATAPRIIEHYRQRDIDIVQVEGIDRPINLLRDTIGLMRLVRHLRQVRYDIVHTHTSKGGIIGRLAATLAQTPITIHTAHGYAFADYAKNAVSRTAFIAAERLATRWCDFIIAVNHLDRDKAIENGIVDPSKILAIPNGIDLTEADAAFASAGDSLHAELGLDPNRPIVGSIGRLSAPKGFEYFIDAIPALAASNPQLQFIIVGEGELDKALRERAARNGVADKLRFIGFRSDTYRLLKSIDIFVMPSVWEGMPMMLLEAMATRRPIVTTRIRGVAAVCGDADVAELVQPADAGAIAAAISKLMADPSRMQQLARRAREHVEKHFSDEVMKARTWSVYERVARAKGVALGTIGDDE